MTRQSRSVSMLGWRCWALQTRLATGSAWICRVGSAWLSSVGMQLLRRDWSKTCWVSVLQLPQQKCDGALNSRLETWRRLESAPALISQRRRISCMAKNGLGGAVGSLGCCLLRIPSEATNFGTSALSLRDLSTLKVLQRERSPHVSLNGVFLVSHQKLLCILCNNASRLNLEPPGLNWNSYRFLYVSAHW